MEGIFPDIIGLGVGGVVLIIVLRLVFSFLDKRRVINSKIPQVPQLKFEHMQEIYNWTKSLFDMHNVKDVDGVPIWYVRRSMEEALIANNKIIGELKDAIVGLTNVMNLNTNILTQLQAKFEAVE